MGKLNMDLVRKKKASLERQGGNNNYDKLANGKNLRRILFPKGDSEECSSEGLIHFGLGEGGKTSLVCRKTKDPHAKCPVCDYIAKLQKSKDKNDKKLADALKPRKRVFYNVLDRDNPSDKKDTEEVKILAVGTTVQKQIVAIMCDPDYGDITDFETGRDITISRTGQGLNTEYTVMPKPLPTKASDKTDMKTLEEIMTDLDGMWKIPSIEECEEVLYGTDEGDDEDEPRNANGSHDDYEDLELSELEELCEKRGIPLPDKVTKFKLIALLTQYDEGTLDEGDDVKRTISSALNRRK